MDNILLNKDHYYNPNIPFVLSTFIREYDMSKSNISILRYKGFLDEEGYNYYDSLPKIERQVQIGNILRDNREVINILKSGMIEIRNKFILENNLTPENVLSIKNDAFFIVDKIPSITIFDGVEFKRKNTYTSFYKVLKQEYYYSFEKINQFEYLHVKGISDDKVAIHEKYFLDLLKELFFSAETEPIEETIKLLSVIYESYIKKDLGVEYYREFNPISKIRVNVMGNQYLTDSLSEDDKEYIDISYNLSILKQLMKYYSMVVLRYKR